MPYSPFEHLVTPVNGHLHSMYLPPDAQSGDQAYQPLPNGFTNPFDHPQYSQQPIAGPSYLPPPFHPQAVHHLNNGKLKVDYPDGSEWQSNGDWDEDGFRDGHDIIYGNLEVSRQRLASVPPPQESDKIGPQKVKHRRRTTPEQLKVLEHWFDINPKPDNNLREWLASELGMTKRNVQVWFQNRCV